MFYIKNFFQIMINRPFKGLLFCLITTGLCLSFAQRTKIEKNVLQIFGKYESHSYFHALVSAEENFDQISYRLASLPGVVRVEKISKEKLVTKANNILNANTLTEVEPIKDYGYFGLKVILNDSLKADTISMIRKYLTRMVGETEVTLGSIVKVDPKKKIFFLRVKKWGGLTLLLFLMTLWVVILYQLRRDLRRRSYVIEQFQRKNNVEIKSSALGMLLIVLPGVVLATSMGGVQWKEFLLFSLFILSFGIISSRKYSWEDLSSL